MIVTKLPTSDNHTLHVEQYGNPNGETLVFLHGGPGSGCGAWFKNFLTETLDLNRFNIIFPDQRGSGKSTPHASLENNTTSHLVDDLELIRKHFNIDTWHVFGGSWGSTLALAYTDKYSQNIKSLLLYGVFLCRQSELDDMYAPNGVAHRLFPEVFEEYLNILPEEDKPNPIQGYSKLFQNTDEEIRHNAITLWTKLEKAVSMLIVTPEMLAEEISDPDFVLAHSLVENHYFINNGYIDGDKIIQNLAECTQGIPVDIVQGRYDIVCPARTAYDVHKAIPHSVLHIIDNAGHSAKEEKSTAKLKQLLQRL